MFSLKLAITVYILRTWLESTRYFILINPILGTRFQGNEWWNIVKKTFISPFLKHWREGGKNTKQLQSFLCYT